MSEALAARRGVRQAARRARRLPAGRWALRGTALLYLGVMIVLPLVALVVDGYSNGPGNLKSALAYPGAAAALELTIGTAFLVMLLNALFGTLLAWVLVRHRFPGKALLSTIVDLPFAIPTLVTGVMLVALYGPNAPFGAFLDRHGVRVIFTPVGIVLALLFVTLPLVVRTVQPVLVELDRAEEEAARVLGAGRVTTFTRVVLPHLRAAITAGALLAFARSLGEFGAVVVVSGNILGRTVTAPYFIYQLTSQFRYPEAAAVSTVLFAVAFALVLVTDRLVSRWGFEL